ncbi:hypothetical protein HA402_003537 [Bradysia odoriphaga]|nr:hypothetical protein HA402_003537 [Bradysia odoriphaga]
MDLSDFYKRPRYCEEMCKKDVTVKSSNFSIDHILNKAGENISNCCTINEANVLEENFANKYSSELMPMFSWLQYTRYRPPKLTRTHKIGPIKRTPGRLPRVPFTAEQLSSLENAYIQSSYLSSEEANRLAASLDLTSTRVSTITSAKTNRI